MIADRQPDACLGGLSRIAWPVPADPRQVDRPPLPHMATGCGWIARAASDRNLQIDSPGVSASVAADGSGPAPTEPGPERTAFSGPGLLEYARTAAQRPITSGRGRTRGTRSGLHTAWTRKRHRCIAAIFSLVRSKIFARHRSVRFPPQRSGIRVTPKARVDLRPIGGFSWRDCF